MNIAFKILYFFMGLITFLFSYVKFRMMFGKKKPSSNVILKNDYYTVVSVTDGDTFVVQDEFKKEFMIRLIGVDSPETVHPNKGEEFFGKAAKQITEEKLLDHKVYLERDYSQDDEDKYGRRLRYAFLDKVNFNKWLILNGYAYEYTYESDYKYKMSFVKAEKNAHAEKVGIWSDAEYSNYLMDNFVDLLLNSV